MSNRLGPQFYKPNHSPTRKTILHKSFGYKADPEVYNSNPGPGKYIDDIINK